MTTKTTRLPSPTELRLIEKVKDLRSLEGISQTELSSLSGVPQKTISRMENSLSIPTLGTLEALLEALGYTLSFDID